jgi:hypothetical protein
VAVTTGFVVAVNLVVMVLVTVDVGVGKWRQLQRPRTSLHSKRWNLLGKPAQGGFGGCALRSLITGAAGPQTVVVLRGEMVSHGTHVDGSIGGMGGAHAVVASVAVVTVVAVCVPPTGPPVTVWVVVVVVGTVRVRVRDTDGGRDLW